MPGGGVSIAADALAAAPRRAALEASCGAARGTAMRQQRKRQAAACTLGRRVATAPGSRACTCDAAAPLCGKACAEEAGAMRLSSLIAPSCTVHDQRATQRAQQQRPPRRARAASCRLRAYSRKRGGGVLSAMCSGGGGGGGGVQVQVHWALCATSLRATASRGVVSRVCRRHRRTGHRLSRQRFAAPPGWPSAERAWRSCALAWCRRMRWLR